MTATATTHDSHNNYILILWFIKNRKYKAQHKTIIVIIITIIVISVCCTTATWSTNTLLYQKQKIMEESK